MSLSNKTLENMRETYLQSSLDEGDVLAEPTKQLERWLEEALKAQCEEPNAMVLSTVEGERVRARVVLLKGIIEGKLSFYTNYQSAKGNEISKQASAALTFFWPALQRQIRVEGKLSLMPSELSDVYFSKRPRGSQLGAVASPQSKVMKNRAELENLFKAAEEKYKDQSIPRPANWGGYYLTPKYFEFWQGRENRLHDRICFELESTKWKIKRLAP